MNYYPKNNNYNERKNLSNTQLFKEVLFSIGIGFPYYILKSSVSEKEDKSLCHIILKRPKDRKIDELYNSIYYKETIQILNEFLDSTKIECNLFTRISYNLSYNNGFEKCGEHQDHVFPHKQIIIYLNGRGVHVQKRNVVDSGCLTVVSLDILLTTNISRHIYT